MADVTMVERVARAIHASKLVQPGAGTWKGEGVTERFCMEAARAAIAAMREPTHEMIEASWEATKWATPDERMRTAFMTGREAHIVKQAARWRASIDAALYEPETPEHALETSE